MNKPQAIISDLDNCLAYPGNRDVYDASTCVNDSPNYILISVIKTFYPNYQIIISTGRPQLYAGQTVNWLTKQGVPYTKIFMRPTHDKETSGLRLKEQWLLDSILPNYEVILSFEDNYRTADMYRHYSIPCWQVERDSFLDNSYEKMKSKKESSVTNPLPGLPEWEEESDEDIGFIQY